jgi:hypothetical protein
VAAELGADLRIERDDRGRFPLVAFRAHGLSASKDGPAEPGRDSSHS